MRYPATRTSLSTGLSAITAQPAGDLVLVGTSSRRGFAHQAPCPPAEEASPLAMPWLAVSGDRAQQPAPAPAVDEGLGQRTRRCKQCRCILSRYNEEAYCSSCARSTRNQPGPVPCVASDVWARADVQEALVARDFGKLCQLVRVASDLRQSDMAELTGLSQAFLSMLESRARRLTNIDKITELLAGLGTPAELTGPMLRMPRPNRDEPDVRHGMPG
ncbi:hypothetical protein GCM10010339_70760 [Streptomyces alanosinicus]|uniref:HTH cro/C1-type domain-containing protein n=1 Tax=Streptomyces alanosinicus TaxID=68171 RepID=A0A919D5A7_9ACTN|nr:hypothetical protein GCM10010339_70760 [Streptomyces alanosinicus]